MAIDTWPKHGSPPRTVADGVVTKVDAGLADLLLVDGFGNQLRVRLPHMVLRKLVETGVATLAPE